eukprot:jgi/Chlat1/5809/Chrsp4S06171
MAAAAVASSSSATTSLVSLPRSLFGGCHLHRRQSLRPLLPAAACLRVHRKRPQLVLRAQASSAAADAGNVYADNERARVTLPAWAQTVVEAVRRRQHGEPLPAWRVAVRMARKVAKVWKLAAAAAGGGVSSLTFSAGLASTVPVIGGAVASFIKMYLLLLFLRVLLTWFPTIEWDASPWVTLRQVTDPYLNVFRNMIPPVAGQIDFTPIIGFLVLQFLVQVLEDTVLDDDL